MPEVNTKYGLPFFRRHGIFIALLCGWLGLNLYFLPGRSLWAGEFFTIFTAAGRNEECRDWLNSRELMETKAGAMAQYWKFGPRDSLPRFFHDLIHHDIHPPVFFLLLRGWMKLGLTSTLGLTALPLIISGLALILLYLMALQMIARPWHYLVPGLWMISLSGWNGNWEIRYYGLYLLEATGLIWLFVAGVRSPTLSGRRWFPWLVAGIMALGGLTLYLFVLLILALDLWVLLAVDWKERSPRPWLIANLAAGAVLVGWAPWAWIQFQQQGVRLETPLSGLETGQALLRIIVTMVISPPSLLTVPTAAVLALLTVGLVFPPFPSYRRLAGLVFGLCLLLPAFLKAAGILRISHLLQYRYFMALTPIILCSVVQGIAVLPRPRYRAAAALFLLLMCLANFGSYLAYYQNCRTRQNPNTCPSPATLARSLEKTSPDPDFVVVLATKNHGYVSEVASELNPRRALLLADCPALIPALPAWAEQKKPRLILYLERRYPAGDAQCLPQIANALGPAYGLPNQPRVVQDWNQAYFLRK